MDAVVPAAAASPRRVRYLGCMGWWLVFNESMLEKRSTCLIIPNIWSEGPLAHIHAR